MLMYHGCILLQIHFFMFPESICVEFVMNKVALWEVSLLVPWRFPVRNIQCSCLMQLLSTLRELWANVSCIKRQTVFCFNYLPSALFFRSYIFLWYFALEAFGQNVDRQFWCPLESVFIWKFPFSFCRKGTFCITYRQLRLYGIPIVTTHTHAHARTRTHTHTKTHTHIHTHTHTHRHAFGRALTVIYSCSFVLHTILKLRNVTDWLWYGPMATLLSYFNLCIIWYWIHVSIYRSNSVAQLSHTYRISN
jgi:hypothetical protein